MCRVYKNRISFIFLILFYRLVLDVVYIELVSKFFSYLGFIYQISFYKLFISYILLILTGFLYRYQLRDHRIMWLACYIF
jgi:hypothetical protein